ncbi:MAG TPA: hypothetical protein VFV19_16610 [Candidatus Polarisedimenticolaceae bacterium]|nr:hypothetical protein [Candidatus Polarisedimenticolaceae bacterium]
MSTRFVSLIAAVLCATGLAMATPEIDTFVLTVGGQSQPTFPDPPPFSCGTYGTPPPVFPFFGGLGVSMPTEGYAACDIAGGYRTRTGPAGPLADATSLDVDYDNFDNDHSTGSADAKADFGVLGARAYARLLATPGYAAPIVQGAEAYGKFTDTLTITSPNVASGASGYVRFHFWIDGHLNFTGNDDVRMTVLYQASPGPIYPLMITGGANNNPQPYISYPAGFGGASGPGTFGGFTLAAGSSSGAGEFVTFLLPINFGTSFDFTAGLMVYVLPGATLDGFVDFLSTARLTGIEVMDAGMTPVPAFSVAAGSGTNYDANGVHYPVDPCAPIVSSGAPVPAGTGIVTSFAEGPVSRGGRDAFIASGTSGQEGVYVRATPPNPIKVADLASAIPEGTGTFTGFGNLSMAASLLGFIGSGAGQEGVYVADLSDLQVPPNPIEVADLAYGIPGGSGTFTGFGDLSLAGIPPTPIRAAFVGSGVGQQGVYLADLSNLQIPPDPIRLVDLTTAIPGGTGDFTAFREVSMTISPSASHVGFVGSGTSQEGLYLADVTDLMIPPSPVRIADGTTPVPGGSGAFTGFGHLSLASPRVASPAAWPTRIAFVGAAAGQQGVYLSEVSNSLVPPSPIRLVDLNTPIPGGTGTYTGFDAVSAGGNVTAFRGMGSNGQAGIYLASPPTKVIAIGDTLEGKTVTGVTLGREGLDGDQLDFGASFSDGSQAMLVYTVPSLLDSTGAGTVGDSLRVDRSVATPGNVKLSWSASCSVSATDYAIYEGTLGNWYSHTMRTCTDTGADLTEDLAPAAGNRYYLIVALGSDGEGSYGTDSTGAERPIGSGSRCEAVQSIGPCP